ncbi:LamG-like jellyroll fold domain-containing protein [Rubripirellula reticaptiva]|uniref:FecR protein n=1 Tax=Rubripirellula reticaptiva TaxID=2528013 RepID=A0A5C6FDV0_9BACT|nr:LamG-like jellyroll fold domain-containing protein [Rubripirellula reticaptiva]TWU58384.1 FecR protein [Rubripirellula reticaptiva]
MMPIDDELIDRFIDGEASDDEAAEIVRWLEETENLQRFARRAELHSDLRSSLLRKNIQAEAIGACEEVKAEPARTLPDPSVGRLGRPVQFAVGFAVAALVTAACLIIAFWIPTDEQEPVALNGNLATVVSQIDAVLTSGRSNWNKPDLVAGEYQLKQGLLHLRFDGGVMVYVEAPAQFHVSSGKRLVLHRGRLSANVPPAGVGFAVDTPEAEVIDFGTEFSVDVESGTSEVHVFNGLVRVQPRPAQDGVATEAVDLRTSQAVKIEASTQTSSKIELATERFIRSFDEPKRMYLRSLKQLSPVAYYRMGIRDYGLVSHPSQYSGEVLIDRDSVAGGSRPPHAPGVFAGGSLRVGTGSTGRGGRVTTLPPLESGQFTLAVFVYLETETPNGIVTTNIRNEKGSFALSLDERGALRAIVRDRDRELQSVISNASLPLSTWRHIVVTADGDHLRFYEDGQLVSSVSCKPIARAANETLWFGTDAGGRGQWNGRIDELALFDKALSESEIAELYQAAVDEIARAK